MAKHKENRTIPPLVISKDDNETAFDSSGIVETEDFTCFGITPKEKRSLCVRIIKHQHAEVLIQFSRILSPLKYTNNRLSFQTMNTRVEISGKNLKPLLYYLGEHRLAWIMPNSMASPTESFMLKDGEPEIIVINLIDKEKEAAKKRAEKDQGQNPS